VQAVCHQVILATRRSLQADQLLVWQLQAWQSLGMKNGDPMIGSPFVVTRVMVDP